MKPRVEVIALGGTIASKPRPGQDGVFPDLTAEDIISAAPAISQVADVGARTYAAVPSVEIDIPMMRRIIALMTDLEAKGVSGFIITQGTDTIEETAYVFDLLWGGQSPVIVTGAMRNAAQPGADGAANILAAIVCAADPLLQDAGVLVVMDDKIHAAAWVQKGDTSNVSAFTSPAPVGWIAEGKPALYAKPVRQRQIGLPADAGIPFVPILKPGLGDPPLLIQAALDLGAEGIVADLSGGGHGAVAWADALETAATTVPVVFSSRTRGGRVLSNTYGQLGAEIDLIRRGLVPSRDLDALKARLLLSLLLMAGAVEQFEQHAILSWRNMP